MIHLPLLQLVLVTRTFDKTTGPMELVLFRSKLKCNLHQYAKAM